MSIAENPPVTGKDWELQQVFKTAPASAAGAKVIYEERVIAPVAFDYDHYRELGGIINQTDYEEALRQAATMTWENIDNRFVSEAQTIADISGFSLKHGDGQLDPITALYAVLRGAWKPKEEQELYHCDLPDQRLLAEALRMLDLRFLLERVKEVHPNIKF